MEGFRNEGFVEVAVVEYPGGDPSAASVLTEMAHVANRLAQQQRRPFKRVLVTRWIVPASTLEVTRPFSRRSSISGVAPTRPSTS